MRVVTQTYLVTLHFFAESLQHHIRPQISVTSLYERFRAQCVPYKEVTELRSNAVLQGFCKTLYYKAQKNTFG